LPQSRRGGRRRPYASISWFASRSGEVDTASPKRLRSGEAGPVRGSEWPLGKTACSPRRFAFKDIWTGIGSIQVEPAEERGHPK
jgi:hypothetical protein